MSKHSIPAAAEGMPTLINETKDPKTVNAEYAAGGTDCDVGILESYREWLHYEGRLCGMELYPELGADADRFIPRTDIFKFHFPMDKDWRSVARPSSRAELVLKAVGALPEETGAGADEPGHDPFHGQDGGSMDALSTPSHHADALSFMRRRRPAGTGIDYWCVEPSGNYAEDVDTGRRLATEYLDFVGKRPTAAHATLLNCIVGDIHENAGSRPFTGVEAGFFRQINEFAMVAARIWTGNHPTKKEGGAA
ncbi:MAG: hypothetical protein ACTHJ3_05100 [Pararhizobium sp.]